MTVPCVGQAQPLAERLTGVTGVVAGALATGGLVGAGVGCVLGVVATGGRLSAGCVATGALPAEGAEAIG